MRLAELIRIPSAQQSGKQKGNRQNDPCGRALASRVALTRWNVRRQAFSQGPMPSKTKHRKDDCQTTNKYLIRFTGHLFGISSHRITRNQSRSDASVAYHFLQIQTTGMIHRKPVADSLTPVPRSNSVQTQCDLKNSDVAYSNTHARSLCDWQGYAASLKLHLRGKMNSGIGRRIFRRRV